jgi:L-asparagine transporter-like permease
MRRRSQLPVCLTCGFNSCGYVYIIFFNCSYTPHGEALWPKKEFPSPAHPHRGYVLYMFSVFIFDLMCVSQNCRRQSLYLCIVSIYLCICVSGWNCIVSGQKFITEVPSQTIQPSLRMKTTLEPNPLMIRLLPILLPILWMAEEGGPINLTSLLASNSSANFAFSDKNPYPGWMAWDLVKVS